MYMYVYIYTYIYMYVYIYMYSLYSCRIVVNVVFCSAMQTGDVLTNIWLLIKQHW